MAARASAFAFENHPAARRVSIGRGCPAAGGRRMQIFQDRSRLKIGELVGRHRRSGNPVLNDPDHLVFSRPPAELAVPQIHAVHQVAFRPMTSYTVVAEQLSAILDIGGGEAVLSEEWDSGTRRHGKSQSHSRHKYPALNYRRPSYQNIHARSSFDILAGRWSVFILERSADTCDSGPCAFPPRSPARSCLPRSRSSLIIRSQPSST